MELPRIHTFKPDSSGLVSTSGWPVFSGENLTSNNIYFIFAVIYVL